VIDATPVVAFILSGAVAEDTSVPLVVGSVRVGVPAAACDVIVAVPLVSPLNPIEPWVNPLDPTSIGMYDVKFDAFAFHTRVELKYKLHATAAVNSPLTQDIKGALPP
jgi:hypothetical protein